MACISRHWPGNHGVSFHDPRGDAGHERGETNMQDDDRLPCLLASCLVVLPIITACADTLRPARIRHGHHHLDDGLDFRRRFVRSLRAERSLRRGVRFRRQRDWSEYHTRNRPTQSRLSIRRTFEGGESAFQSAERTDMSAPMSMSGSGAVHGRRGQQRDRGGIPARRDDEPSGGRDRS